MAELVQQDKIVRTAQRGERAHGSSIAGGKRQGCFGFFESGQRALEGGVRGEAAADQPRLEAAGTNRRFTVFNQLQPCFLERAAYFFGLGSGSASDDFGFRVSLSLDSSAE